MTKNSIAVAIEFMSEYYPIANKREIYMLDAQFYNFANNSGVDIFMLYKNNSME